MSAPKHRISVGLDNHEHAELLALSKKHRVSLAWLSRQAVIEFLERYRFELLQLPLKLPEKKIQDEVQGGKTTKL